MIDEIVQELDSSVFRHVMKHYPTGVCVITALDSFGAIGITVGSFTSVSLQPALVGFFIDRCSGSWDRLQRVGKFCVNVLASDQGELCRRFAAKSADKFAGLPLRLSSNGSPILDSVVAWIDCTVHAVHPAGDHWIVLGRVHQLKLADADQPLLFFGGQLGKFVSLNDAN